MASDNKFLNFPITLLRELYSDCRQFANNAFDVGIYLYSLTLEGDEKKRFEDAGHFLSVKNGNLWNAKEALKDIPATYPRTGIDKEILFNYYRFTKTEFEIVCLGAFLGIKSIIGKKPYDKTNKILIHARMFGYCTTKELPKKLTELQLKYKQRYHMDRVLTELQLNWNLKVLWNHNRGFYVSFDLSLDDLAVVVEKDKRRYQLRKLQDAKKAAIERAKTTAS
jgi:hypothetical protein